VEGAGEACDLIQHEYLVGDEGSRCSKKPRVAGRTVRYGIFVLGGEVDAEGAIITRWSA